MNRGAIVSKTTAAPYQHKIHYLCDKILIGAQEHSLEHQNEKTACQAELKAW